MGCGGSKAATKQDEQKVENQAPSTLLTTESPVEAAKEAEPATAVDAPKEGETKADSVPLPLQISIVSARGLRNADWVGKSDPYCTCEVSGKPETKLETPALTDQLNPEWNHEAQISGYCVGDSVTFVVKDKDPAKPDDFLGKLVMEGSQFYPNGFEGEVPLTEAGAGIDAFMKVKVVVVHPKVRVTVVSAQGLRNADWVGKSDPYCICEVAGKADVKFMTPSVDDNLNPKWDHEGEVTGYQAPDTLTFTVKDKDPLKPDDILGSVSLPYDSFKNGYEGELKLTQTGEGMTSSLLVNIAIGEKVEQVPSQVEEEQKVVAEEAKGAPVEDAPSPQVVADELTITTDTAPPKAMSCWC